MSKSIREIFLELSHTASWAGVVPDAVSDRNWLGDTPLHTACTWGDVDVVRVLVENGADVNASGDLGSPPLINAIIGGNELVVDLLLRMGANPELKNDMGWTPISYAHSRKKTKAIISMLENAHRPKSSKGKKK